MWRGVLSWGVSVGPLGPGFYWEKTAPVWIYRVGSRDGCRNSHPEWKLVAGAEDPVLEGGDSNTVVKGFEKPLISLNPVK